MAGIGNGHDRRLRKQLADERQ
eukprot:ctg_3815.g485